MPRPLASSELLPLPKRSTKNVSLVSRILSPSTSTVIVFDVSPGLNVTVPVAAV